MENQYYTIFVSKTGSMSDPTYMLWVETKSEEIYKKALAAVEPNGWKVAKVYKPSDELTTPNFSKCVNI